MYYDIEFIFNRNGGLIPTVVCTVNFNAAKSPEENWIVSILHIYKSDAVALS